MENLENNSIINWEAYMKLRENDPFKLETKIRDFKTKEMDNPYLKIMTQEIAEDIKRWRVEEEYTWRSVHREYQKKYIPEEQWYFNEIMVERFGKSEPSGHQMDGIELCHAAMLFLGEKVEDGWN